MITCKECNEKFKIKPKRYKTKCPHCNDIIDFSDMGNVCLFMDLVFLVSLAVCIFIGRFFFNRLPLLQEIGATSVMLIIVGGTGHIINKWVVRKMYNKL